MGRPTSEKPNRGKLKRSFFFFFWQNHYAWDPRRAESLHISLQTQNGWFQWAVPPLWLGITKTCDVLTSLWQNPQTFIPSRPLTWNYCMLFFLWFALFKKIEHKDKQLIHTSRSRGRRLSITSWQLCAYGHMRLRHKKHMVRVIKRSCFTTNMGNFLELFT